MSSSQSFPSTTARNSSPASQAEPMMSPSRFSLMRDLGMMGVALEVFQVGQGDELIQVAQPHLVLGQDDQVLGLAAHLSRPPLRSLGMAGLISPRVCTPMASSFSKKGGSM